MTWEKIINENQISQIRIGDLILHYDRAVIQIPDKLTSENIGALFSVESFTEREIVIRSNSKNSTDIQGALNSVYPTRVLFTELILTGSWFLKVN